MVNGKESYGVKGDLRRNENNTLWNLDPYVQASWQFLPKWHLDTGLRYSSSIMSPDDHYILDKNGDDSGSTDYQKLLRFCVALGWGKFYRNFIPMPESYGKGLKRQPLPKWLITLILRNRV